MISRTSVARFQACRRESTAAQVGTIIEVDESGTPRRYVITDDGTITPLTDFSYKLYQASWADRGIRKTS